MLYSKVQKAISVDSFQVLVNDNPDSMSGVKVLKVIEDQVNTAKSSSEVELLYRAYYDVKRGEKESISEYTAKVVRRANCLRGTKYQQDQDSIAQKWHFGLGSSFDLINNSIDVLGIIPRGWELLTCIL